MPVPPPEQIGRCERLSELLEADATKLILSALIIVSVLPFAWVERSAMGFFAVFAAELAARIVLLREQLRRRRLNRTEVVVLALDLVATLSFLPLEGLFEVRFLRLIRLSRMLLLLSYWSPVGKEIWVILSKRERRYQLLFVASMVVLLTFTAGILLYHVGPAAIDYDENGKLDNPGFWTLVWWSFRQLQDPGNLVKTPSATFAFVLSLVLTLAGIFVITFLIGIGTSVVRELVEVGRQRRLGLREHSLIVNLGPHSGMLVEELVAYYAKSFRSPRLATMGPAASRYDYMYRDRLRRVRYREGVATSPHDLLKVDADRARRVILLGEGEHNLADAEVVSQVLAVRQLNPACRIFAEVVRPDNVRAAMSAGGPQTVPVLAHRLVSLLIADLLAFPGVERVYDQLLSSQGHEIYTCYYGVGAMEGCAPGPQLQEQRFGPLCRRLHASHGVLLLGWSTGDPMGTPRHTLAPPADTPLPPTEELTGLIALAPHFEAVADAVRDLSSSRAEPSKEEPPTPELPWTLEAQSRPLKQILVCGYHEGLSALCEELVLFCPGIEITLMVPSDLQARRLERQLLAGADDASAKERERRALFSRQEDGLLSYRPPTGGEQRPGGTLRLIATDWSEGQTLWQPHGDFCLANAEAVLLTYTTSDTDPDGRTALAMLKLMDRLERRPETLHEDLRVICEVLDTAKAELLDKRFCDHSAPAGTPSEAPRGPLGDDHLVVISAERLRHALLAQAIFVPGSDAIYTQLLGQGDVELHRLVPSAMPTAADAELPASSRGFATLIEGLMPQGLLPLAVEVERDGQRQLLVNPGSDAGARFGLHEVRAVFALGQP